MHHLRHSSALPDYIGDGWPAFCNGGLPRLAIGHQGLFFERFDGTIASHPLAAAELTAPGGGPVEPGDPGWSGESNYTLGDAENSGFDGPAGLYFNVNRWYAPHLGRFTSKDPNETAAPIVTAMTSNGMSMLSAIGQFSAAAHFADGMHVYAAYGNNPIMGSDPLGLEWGYEEDVDEAMQNIGPDRIAALAALAARTGMYVNTAMMIGQFALQFVPGYDAVELIVLLGQGKYDLVIEDFAMRLGYAAVGPIFKAAAKLTTSLFRYITRGLGKWFRKNGDDLTASIGKACRRLVRRVNSVVEGTPVETVNGPIPIECVKAGDHILALSENAFPQPAGVCRVTAVWCNSAPGIIRIYFENESELAVTPDHEIFVIERGWLPAGALRVSDNVVRSDGSLLGVVAVDYEPGVANVYDIRVDGAFTFYASDVWVHNCGGDFKDVDWTDFPNDVPRPSGAFRLIDGDEYEAARRLADKTNKDPLLRAKLGAGPDYDIHEIHPVKFGGSPTDLANKVAIKRTAHRKVNGFFNSLMYQLQRSE